MNPVFGSFVIHLDLNSLDYYCHCLICFDVEADRDVEPLMIKNRFLLI